jgi:hypothetical protein
MRLSRALDCSSTLPDALLIDLDMGQDSGFEIHRFRYETPAILKLPALVWTHLDARNRSFCELFHISNYVDKADGIEALREALSKVTATRTSTRLTDGRVALPMGDGPPSSSATDFSFQARVDWNSAKLRSYCALIWILIVSSTLIIRLRKRKPSTAEMTGNSPISQRAGWLEGLAILGSSRRAWAIH